MIDSERLGGFGDRLTNKRTDICECRVAFATENDETYGIFHMGPGVLGQPAHISRPGRCSGAGLGPSAVRCTLVLKQL